MKWYFIDNGFNTGSFNMDFDINLAKNFLPDSVYFRLYRWKPYCISLGANQSFDEIKLSKTAEDNIDVVKRPTGGRAILHSEELTYSVVMPVDFNFSPKTIYHEINKAIYKSLKIYDNRLTEIELEKTQADFSSLYKNQTNAICFAVSAKNEINYNGQKLVGSAQRKMGNVVLQHGSILCGEYHKKIVNYLNFDETKLKVVKEKLDLNTIDLESILNESIDYDRLLSSLYVGFEKYFNIKMDRISQEEIFNTENII